MYLAESCPLWIGLPIVLVPLANSVLTFLIGFNISSAISFHRQSLTTTGNLGAAEKE
jgi:hypothetical protein